MKYLMLIMCMVLCTACGKQDSEKPGKATRSDWASEQADTLKKTPVRLEEQVLSEEGMDAEKVTIMDMMDRVMKEER